MKKNELLNVYQKLLEEEGLRNFRDYFIGFRGNTLEFGLSSEPSDCPDDFVYCFHESKIKTLEDIHKAMFEIRDFVSEFDIYEKMADEFYEYPISGEELREMVIELPIVEKMQKKFLKALNKILKKQLTKWDRK